MIEDTLKAAAARKIALVAKAREWNRCLIAASTPERRAACARARHVNMVLAREIHLAEQGNAAALWGLDASATLRRWGTSE